MDRLAKILTQSLGAVKAFRLRTLFCVTSVALGIASIVVIVAAVEGAYKRAFEIVKRFGPDSLIIFSGGEEARARGERQKTVTLEDVKAVRQTFQTAYFVVPFSSVRGPTVSYKNKNAQPLVVGSTSDYSNAWTWPLLQGSDFTEEQVRGLRNVALIGQYLLQELFEDEDPVGKYVLVKGIPVQIVGVLSERGISRGGDNLDDRIVIPLTTMMKKIQNETTYITGFRVRFTDRENLYDHVEELRSFLRQRHAIPEDEPDDFRVLSPKEIIEFLVALTGSLVSFLAVTGTISLAVAGFVLANLFLLSVKERTSEIGIRRAAGARKRDIFFQFLGESVILTTAGGVAGFFLGLFSSKLLVLIAQFPIHFSWRAFVVGLLLSWVVGIGFGLQPAARAADLKPIEAIRE